MPADPYRESFINTLVTHGDIDLETAIKIANALAPFVVDTRNGISHNDKELIAKIALISGLNPKNKSDMAVIDDVLFSYTSWLHNTTPDALYAATGAQITANATSGLALAVNLQQAGLLEPQYGGIVVGDGKKNTSNGDIGKNTPVIGKMGDMENIDANEYRVAD